MEFTEIMPLTCVKLMQLANVSFSIAVTLDGISIWNNSLMSANAFELMIEVSLASLMYPSFESAHSLTAVGLSMM